MTPLSRIQSRLKEIRERADAATAGKWLRSENSLGIFSAEKPICIVESNHKRDGQNIYREWEPRDNAEFIAHSRTDIPALLDALEVALKFIEEEECCICDSQHQYACVVCELKEEIAKKLEQSKRRLEGK